MADRRLQVFHTVARLLSFTKAAETLHMTQPAVTFQVRQLEEMIARAQGAPLFLRGGDDGAQGLAPLVHRQLAEFFGKSRVVVF